MLAPAHDIQNIMAPKTATMLAFRLRPSRLNPKPITTAGKRHSDSRTAARLLTAELEALVEIFSTTSTAELPGVTGLEGLKTHCACAGNPAVQARLTGPVNDDPTG